MQQSPNGLHPITYFASICLFFLVCYNQFIFKRSRPEQRARNNDNHLNNSFSYVPSHYIPTPSKSRFSTRSSSESPIRSRMHPAEARSPRINDMKGKSPTRDWLSISNYLPSRPNISNYGTYRLYENAGSPQMKQAHYQDYESLYKQKNLVVDKRRDVPEEDQQRELSRNREDSLTLYGEALSPFKREDKPVSNLMPSFNPRAFNKDSKTDIRRDHHMTDNVSPNRRKMNQQYKSSEDDYYTSRQGNNLHNTCENKDPRKILPDQTPFYTLLRDGTVSINNMEPYSPFRSSRDHYNRQSNSSLDSQFNPTPNYTDHEQSHKLMSLKDDKHRLSNVEVKGFVMVDELPSESKKQIKKRKRDEQEVQSSIVESYSVTKAVRLKDLKQEDDYKTFTYSKNLTDSNTENQIRSRAEYQQHASQNHHSLNPKYGGHGDQSLKENYPHNTEYFESATKLHPVRGVVRTPSSKKHVVNDQEDKRYDAFVYSRKKSVRISRIEENIYQIAKSDSKNSQIDLRLDARGHTYTETIDMEERDTKLKIRIDKDLKPGMNNSNNVDSGVQKVISSIRRKGPTEDFDPSVSKSEIPIIAEKALNIKSIEMKNMNESEQIKNKQQREVGIEKDKNIVIKDRTNLLKVNKQEEVVNKKSNPFVLDAPVHKKALTSGFRRPLKSQPNNHAIEKNQNNLLDKKVCSKKISTQENSINDDKKDDKDSDIVRYSYETNHEHNHNESMKNPLDHSLLEDKPFQLNTQHQEEAVEKIHI